MAPKQPGAQAQPRAGQSTEKAQESATCTQNLYGIMPGVQHTPPTLEFPRHPWNPFIMQRQPSSRFSDSAEKNQHTPPAPHIHRQAQHPPPTAPPANKRQDRQSGRRRRRRRRFPENSGHLAGPLVHRAQEANILCGESHTSMRMHIFITFSQFWLFLLKHSKIVILDMEIEPQ